MAETLARHDGLLRETIEAHGGHWVKHTGDGTLAVFGSAPHAVEAAIEAQRALGAADWGDLPLKARMGLHTGEAHERDGDYFGSAVNLAARIMSVAHGGQIVIGEITHRLTPDTQSVDLGEHVLPDVEMPQHLFQVVAEGLEQEFPPLRVSGETPTNLPDPRTSFVGREDEVAALGERLRELRLVTLTGVGGAGKTRLALEVARRSLDEFSDGVFFADLSPLTDGTAVMNAVAEALGMPPARGPAGGAAASVEANVIGFLRQRHVLLILDNCEHLLDECAELVDRLLADAPRLAVLATSREALALEGEHIWQVRSLALPTQSDDVDAEAMRLLLDRIRAVKSDFELSDDHVTALAEICQRLDGIPLAIELAAARAAHLSPREIAERLDDRFKLLAGVRRRTQRQQTLHATVDWSYDLLDGGEQAVLRRFAVFAGGFDLEAMEGVCLEGVDEAGVDVIGSLVAKSLVIADEEAEYTRYRLLETIRLYAEEKLVQADEAEMLRTRHRDWYLAWLEGWRWDECLVGEATARMINREFDNIRVALDWCLDRGDFDLLRRMLLRMVSVLSRYARFTEADRWFDAGLEHEATLGAGERLLQVVAHQMNTWRWTGDIAEAQASLDQLDVLVRDLPERHPVTALGYATMAGLSSVYPKQAEEIVTHAQRGIDAAGDEHPVLRLTCEGFKGVGLLYLGRFEEAENLFAKLLDRAEAPEGVSTPAMLALSRYLQGEQVVASELVGEALSQPFAVFEEMLAVSVAASLGELEVARARVRRIVHQVRTAGWRHPLGLSDCLLGFSACAYHEGDFPRAARLLAAVPGMATGTPSLWVLLRHYRDLLRERLDPETRHACVEEGRATSVDDAIDAELARWDTESPAT